MEFALQSRESPPYEPTNYFLSETDVSKGRGLHSWGFFHISLPPFGLHRGLIFDYFNFFQFPHYIRLNKDFSDRWVHFSNSFLPPSYHLFHKGSFSIIPIFMFFMSKSGVSGSLSLFFEFFSPSPSTLRAPEESNRQLFQFSRSWYQN